MKPVYIVAENRGILKIEGEDRYKFLQGLITQDIQLLEEQEAIYSAFLTPQGKYLHDFFIIKDTSCLFIDINRGRLEDLLRRLKLYKLRTDVSLTDVTYDYQVLLFPGEESFSVFDLPHVLGKACSFQGGILYGDPRLTTLGLRFLAPQPFDFQTLESSGFSPEKFEGYEVFRAKLGVPEGPQDMIAEKSIPLECGLDELHAIAWNKGCYIGQELTARTKYRGLVRKRLIPVTLEGPIPSLPAEIMKAEEKVGRILSVVGDQAFALLRLEALKEAIDGAITLKAGETKIIPHIPPWMKIDFNISD